MSEQAPTTTIAPAEPTITESAAASTPETQATTPTTVATTTTAPTTIAESTTIREEEVKPAPITDASTSITITLLALSGSRSTFTLDSSYLKRHSLTISEPLQMTVYNLKECIWKDWKEDEFDVRPASAHFIRLIYFGRLLEDRNMLSDCRMQSETPNVVHMTLRPAESGADDDTRSGKLAAFGGVGSTRGERSSPSCRCVIL